MGEALDIFRKKAIAPSGMSSREWSRVSAAIRTKSFFSAKTEDARLLQRLHDLLDGMMSGKEGAPRSKPQFISDAREWMRNEGMLDSMPVPNDGSTLKERENWQYSVRNQGSLARLGLIFETQMKSIHSQARWERGMSPNLLAAYPAARFVRCAGAKTKRLVHVANEGVVRLKTDFQFWAMEMNSRHLGGFEVPWAPFGYNSYMDAYDVSAKEAEKLGIYDRNNPPKLPDTSVFGSDASNRYGEESQVSIAKLTPEIRAKLISELQKNTTVKLVNDDLLKLTPKPELRRPKPIIKTEAKPKTEPQKTSPDLSISSHLSIAKFKRDEEREAIREAIGAIDLVHQDGSLNDVLIKATYSRKKIGTFSHWGGADVSGDSIEINPTTDMRMIATVHEIGHFIDLRGMSGVGSFYSEENMQEFVKAAMGTQSFSALRTLATRDFYNYAKRPREIFARAYSQYIAVKSKNKKMLLELDEIRKIKVNTQWTDEEFKELEKYIEQAIKNQSWKIN